MRIVERTEKSVLKPDNKHYGLIRSFCHAAKNLYNRANYLIRQEYFASGQIIGYCKLDKLCKLGGCLSAYRDMPGAQSAQQLLRLLSSNWKAFDNADKDYAKHPGKYLGKPKPPKYLDKDGFQVLALTNQTCKLENGRIRFPGMFDGFEISFTSGRKDGSLSLQQVRFVPKRNLILIETVYRIQVPDERPNNGRCVALDLGVNNLAVVANNFYEPAFIVNGRPLKSMNQFYNKKRAKAVSSLMKQFGDKRRWSNKLSNLTDKRNAKIKDYMHKASRFVIDWCLDHDVSKITIGRAIGWKQNCNLKDRNNQNFVGIPFNMFTDMLLYKAEDCGIAAIIVDESYTSGTSAVDREQPCRKFYDKSRRIHRGMFRSNTGTMINADLNAAYQIMSKVVPFQWDRGCVLHPVMAKVA